MCHEFLLFVLEEHLFSCLFLPFLVTNLTRYTFPPTSHRSPVLQQLPTGEGEGQHMLLMRHVNIANLIFLNCYIRGHIRKTFRATLRLPSFAYTSSYTPNNRRPSCTGSMGDVAALFQQMAVALSGFELVISHSSGSSNDFLL